MSRILPPLYNGEFIFGQRHGPRTLIESKSGNKYVGSYKAGERHGKGIS